MCTCTESYLSFWVTPRTSSPLTNIQVTCALLTKMKTTSHALLSFKCYVNFGFRSCSARKASLKNTTLNNSPAHAHTICLLGMMQENVIQRQSKRARFAPPHALLDWVDPGVNSAKQRICISLKPMNYPVLRTHAGQFFCFINFSTLYK